MIFCVNFLLFFVFCVYNQLSIILLFYAPNRHTYTINVRVLRFFSDFSLCFLEVFQIATLPICYWVLHCLYVIGCYVAYMLLSGSIKNRGCSEPLL